jgi:hypothetical protein
MCVAMANEVLGHSDPVLFFALSLSLFLRKKSDYYANLVAVENGAM